MILSLTFTYSKCSFKGFFHTFLPIKLFPVRYIQRPEVFDSMTKGRFLIYNSFFYKKLSVVFGVSFPLKFIISRKAVNSIQFKQNARSEEVDDSTLNVLWRWAREDIFEKSYICIPVHDRFQFSSFVSFLSFSFA